MNLRIPLKPVQGYNKIFDVGEYKMALTKFGLVKLAKGTTFEETTGEMEVALVHIGGNFSCVATTSSSSQTCEVTDGRTSPFTGKPHCLYLPRHV